MRKITIDPYYRVVLPIVIAGIILGWVLHWGYTDTFKAPVTVEQKEVCGPDTFNLNYGFALEEFEALHPKE